jgi:hypothetical protein
MHSIVFLGPTIPISEARKHFPEAEYVGPVKCGDIIRYTNNPDLFSIGIIDGLFQTVPAVFHKEILFAIAKGVHVFGAASMGALRAAELDIFGMVGVGEVYSAFKSGSLMDDDEVAIIHAPKELDYRPLSEAMVNIRASLHAAWEDASITTKTRDSLIAFAKSLYYPDRTAARIRDHANHMDKDEVLVYLKGAGKVDLKKADAIEMLKLMKRFSDDKVQPKPHNFTLEYTDSLDDLVREFRQSE